MWKILKEDGSELKKERDWPLKLKSFIINNHVSIIGAFTGIGIALNSLIKFFIYLYVSGRANYFNIPKEFIINNYGITLYNIVIIGILTSFYCLIITWIVRTIERQKTIIRKMLNGIAWFLVVPLLFIIAIFIVISGGFSVFISALQEDCVTPVIVTLILLLFHWVCLVVFGYGTVRPLMKDLSSEKIKQKKPKNRKGKKIDFKLKGLIIVLIGLILEGVLCYYAGFKGAGTQRNFQITKLESQTYAVIMTDGEEAVIEKCEDQGTELKLNRGEFMKIKCENVLMESKYFEKVLIE